MNDDTNTYRPTPCQLRRRDGLVHLLTQAMCYSGELAAAASAFQHVTRVAVDITYGDATEAELKAAAEGCLNDLEQYVEAEPLRGRLRALIEEIEEDQPELAPAGTGPAGHAEVDNRLDPGDGFPRKERPA